MSNSMNSKKKKNDILVDLDKNQYIDNKNVINFSSSFLGVFSIALAKLVTIFFFPSSYLFLII